MAKAEEMKISDGIQAVIELLGTIYVQAKDFEIQGIPLLSAIKNLQLIKEAAIKAENTDRKEEIPQLDIQVGEEGEPCTE
jgi:hypothetical protein